MLNIVLVEPEIPQNTGNIARTCAVIGASLHLIEPLGFCIDEKHVKRAGLDYWSELSLHTYSNFAHFLEKNPNARLWLFSTHAEKSYSDVQYNDGDFLVFGKETAGLGAQLISQYKDNCVRIPMRSNLRSLNLSNSVAVAAYEAMRQLGFPNIS
jgi:tRNA (cytidine/uridine-2'-O-)-methyltransferase